MRTRNGYQKGSLSRVRRKGGFDVWVFRWRDTQPDGKRRPRKLVVGTVKQLPTESAAWKAVDVLGLNINAECPAVCRSPLTFRELVQHYQTKELDLDAQSEWKTYSTKLVYGSYIDNWILPKWGALRLSALENTPAVLIEEWLASIKRSRGTKAKIRNIFSAICSHAIRYRWMRSNPISEVRQSAKPEGHKVPLDEQELQTLFEKLGRRERTLVLLDVPTGMRVGELLALQWKDIDFQKKQLQIRKSIWNQRVGPTKTKESEKSMPLDDAMVADLNSWRAETPYAGDEDWVFASPSMQGKQPFWPNSLMWNIRRQAKQAGINKHISWHVFRHTFSTLLVENGEDVKTVQSLMRHANSRTTFDIYTHAVTGRKRRAQSRIVEMMLPSKRRSQRGVKTA